MHNIKISNLTTQTDWWEGELGPVADRLQQGLAVAGTITPELWAAIESARAYIFACQPQVLQVQLRDFGMVIDWDGLLGEFSLGPCWLEVDNRGNVTWYGVEKHCDGDSIKLSFEVEV